jgi:hypothetical protein
MPTSDTLPPASDLATFGRAPVVLLTAEKVEALHEAACEVETIAERIRAAAQAGKPRASVSVAVSDLRFLSVKLDQILFGV